MLTFLALIFYHRFRVIKTQQIAYERGLMHYRNVHGDEINFTNCRSFWADKFGFLYRCSELYDESKIDKPRCTNCECTDVYIVCPDLCLDCYNAAKEWEGIEII